MRVVFVAACLAMALAAVWSLWPEAPAHLPARATAEPAAPSARTEGPKDSHAGTGDMQWMANVPTAPGTQATPAWVSMAQAREHGDDRAPPLQMPSAAVVAPTAAQLADPVAYKNYEQSQQARTLAAFASAAEAEIPKLRADVERARREGIAPEEIAKVDAKIARLERMRRSIVEGGAVPAN
ncbi:MAG: hypothetical protein ACJ8GW_06235 [Massilia sp.]